MLGRRADSHQNGETKKMRVGRGLVLVLLFITFLPVCSPADEDPFRQSGMVGERILDLHTYLLRIAERNNWSLIIAQEVRSPTKRVDGKNLGEVLNNYLKGTGFSYRLYENCLFVAEKGRLEQFFVKLPEDAMMLPRGKGDVVVNGVFHSIEIGTFFKMLRTLTGVELRPADNLRANMMLRLIKMPWKTLVIAIVRLNDFKMIRSEFSVVVASKS